MLENSIDQNNEAENFYFAHECTFLYQSAGAK